MTVFFFLGGGEGSRARNSRPNPLQHLCFSLVPDGTLFVPGPRCRDALPTAQHVAFPGSARSLASSREFTKWLRGSAALDVRARTTYRRRRWGGGRSGGGALRFRPAATPPHTPPPPHTTPHHTSAARVGGPSSRIEVCCRLTTDGKTHFHGLPFSLPNCDVRIGVAAGEGTL